jgi:hypothetical protein
MFDNNKDAAYDLQLRFLEACGRLEYILQRSCRKRAVVTRGLWSVNPEPQHLYKLFVVRTR